MRREAKEYRDFAEGRGPADGGPLEILDIRNAGGELDVVIRGGAPPARQRIHFRGVIDFDFYTFGGEDWFDLPQRLNSFTYRHHREGEYYWWLLGDRTEWTFIAAYPEVAPI